MPVLRHEIDQVDQDGVDEAPVTRLGSAARPVAATRSEVAREVNALLGSARFNRDDSRWLSGRRVDLLISPVPAAGGGHVLITLSPLEGRRQDLAGLVVQAVDADGRHHRVRLDEHGNARLSLETESYRLSVEASEVAGSGGFRALRAGRWAGGGVRAAARASLPDPSVDPERTPAGRRSQLLLAPAVAAAVLAALLISFTLSVVRQVPAGALVSAELVPDCAGNAADGNPRHVEVVATWGNEERRRFEEVLRGFTKKTGISVSLSHGKDTSEAAETEDRAKEPDRDLGKTLDQRFVNGCLPGVALLPQTGLLRDLVSKERVFPIEKVAGKQVDRHYNRAWRELGSVDDVLYGVWFKASDKSLIWYNVQAFASAGVRQPPESWAQLKDAAAKLERAGITPFSIAGADDDAWTLTDWFENVYLRTAGRKMYEKLATGEVPWTDRSVVTALETLAEIFGKPAWRTEGARLTSFKESVKKVFDNPGNPEAAMVFEGDFVAGVVAETSSKVGTHALSFPFPAIGPSATDPSATGPVVGGGGGTTVAGEATGGDVAVLMRDDPEARRLLRYLASPEAAEPWMRAGGFLSPNRSANRDVYPDEASRAASKVLVEAESLSFDLSDQLPVAFGGTPGQGMWRILQDFLTDPSDPRGVAKRLQEGYEAAR